jgi:S-(hydroxymethyl)glutathione dehydrogenase / alcohol dehydrogenase
VNSFTSHRLTLEQINEGFELRHSQDGIRSVIQFTA